MMALKGLLGICLGAFTLLSVESEVFADEKVTGRLGGGSSETEIKETFDMEMSNYDPICIDGSVLLTCTYDEKSILKYSWKDKATGIEFANTRSVRVSPVVTTTYVLEITYIDKSDERIQNWDFEGRVPGRWDDPATVLKFRSSHTYKIYSGSKTLWDEGTYAVGNNPYTYHNDNYGNDFYSTGDHTTGTGQMMIVNGAPGKDVVIWEQNINVTAGKQYAFSMWGFNLSRNNPAVLRFSINGDGNALDKFPLENYGNWEQFYRIWTAPVGSPAQVKISLLNNVTERNGNDFAIDDFSFAPVTTGIGEVTVRVMPRIEVARLANSQVCEGADLEIKALLEAGSDVSGYEWRKDNVLLSSTDLLKIQQAGVARDEGVYTCKATGICGSDSVSFNLYVRDTLKLMPLLNIKACKDRPVSWGVHPEAGYNPAYKWTLPVDAASARWTGKNTATLSKNAVDLTDIGTYLCQVTNICGTKELKAELSVADELKILSVSPDVKLCGGLIKLGVQVNLDNVTVTWTRPDGTTYVGDTLEIPDVTNTEKGTYTCTVVSNECAKSVTGVVNVDLYPELGALTVTEARSVCRGENVFFEAAATGESLKYNWTGPNGFVAKTAAITLTGVEDRNVGVYKVTATDICGNKKSGETSLKILKPVAGLKITPEVKICPGTYQVLEVTGGGYGLNYLWTSPSGAQTTGSRLFLNNAGWMDAGMYTCRVTGFCAVDTTLSVNLALYKPLVATGNTGIFRQCPGDNVSFRVTADGESLTYTWSKDGHLLAGNASNSLELTGVRESDAGVYTCQVQAACGTSASFTYTLQLKPQTKIVDKTLDKDVAEHESVYLFVSVEGENNRFVWKKDGRVIDGETTDHLRINNIEGLGDYIYSCEVVGDCGRDEAKIKIHVGAYSLITKDENLQLCENKTFTYKLSLIPAGCNEGVNLAYCWIYGSDTVSRSAILNLRDLKVSDAGLYVGTAIGSCGRQEVKVNIDVTEIPRLIGIKNNDLTVPDTIVLCGGDDARISPWVAGGSFSGIEWRREGVVVGNAREYKIIDATPERDYAHYTCTINGECGESSRDFVVIVRRKLKILDYQPYVSACIGDKVEFRVTVSGYNDTYEWSGPGAGWGTSQVNIYRKNSVNLKDAGTYRCIVNSFCGTDTLYSELEVEKELLVLDVTGDQIVCHGALIEMKVMANMDSVEYEWTLPGGSVRTERSFKINVTEADTGIYTYKVKGRCITIPGRVHIGMYRRLGELTLTGETIVCENKDAHFRALITGDNLQYRWMGPNKFVAATANVTIGNVTAAKTGKYELTVTDGCLAQKKGSIRLDLLKDVENLTLNTTDTTVCPGSDVILEVKGITSGLTYNWKHSGNIVGTGARLLLSHVQAAHVGEYVCEVTGACKTIQLKTKLSLYKTLAANVREALIRECQGNSVEFVADADGVDVAYQWLKGGVEVGTRGNKYRIAAIIPSDAGMYRCRVSSKCGTALLDYELQLKPKTLITSTSPDKFICQHEAANLEVVATGEDNTYQWWCDSELLSATSPKLTISDVGMADTLVYTSVVKGDCGTDTAFIKMVVGAFFPVEGGTDTLCEHSNYIYNMENFPVYCYGNENFEYIWYKVGGDTLSFESILKFTDVTLADEGKYACYVKEECGDTTVYLNVKVMRLPEIQTMTQDTFVVEGSCYTISVAATGEKLTYHWMRDQQTLGTKTSQIVLCPVDFVDQGRYQVKVSNRCSHVEARMDLGIWQETTIVSPLERDMRICAGDSVRMTVEAWGEAGLLYKWYHDGTLMAVPFVNELFINKTSLRDAGVYTCIVSGRGGEDSCKINLKIDKLPEGNIKGDFELCMGDFVRVYKAESNESRIFWQWDIVNGIINWGGDRKETSVTWTGIDTALIGVTMLDLTTGCHDRIARTVRFKSLPDVNLDIPEYVGNCIDSLELDFAYPSGGYYLVEGIEAVNVYFENKEITYHIDYYYTDSATMCGNTVKDEIRVDIAPYLTIPKDTVEVSGCGPSVLNVVSDHSVGKIKWIPSRWLSVDTVSAPVYTPGKTHFYTVLLTDKYGCEAEDKVLIDVAVLPKIYMMPDTVIGECNEIPLKCHWQTPYFGSLVWYKNSRMSATGQTTTEELGKILGDNRYTAAVSDKFGCSAEGTVLVKVLPADGFEDGVVCVDRDPLVVDCSRFKEYVWEDGYTDAVRTLTRAGDYRLWLTDKFGCGSEAEFEIHPLPAVHLQDTFIFENQSMEYALDLDMRYAPYEIRWQDGSNSTNFQTGDEGYYQVTVIDNIGCTAWDTAFLEVKKMRIAAPDAFLPQSSGENAKFYLKEVNFVGTFEMYIYDRWGELVYKTSEIGFNGGWDGVFKGASCLPGAYVWVAFNNGEVIGRGTVMLIR